MSREDRILDLTLSQLDRLANFYPRVDGKAAFLLAFNVGLASIVILNVDFTGQFVALRHGAALIFATLTGLSCIELRQTFFPHLAGGVQQSHTYFADIAKQSCADFKAEWERLTPADRIADATIQVWRNSEILTIKFRSTERAFKLTMLAVIPWAVTIYNVAVGGQIKLS